MKTKYKSPKNNTYRSKRPRRASGSFDDTLYDCIIVGAGAAGIVAGIFSARRGLSTLIIGTDLGGQTASTAEVENYPGCGAVEGPGLIAQFFNEAKQFGCLFLTDVIHSLKKDTEEFVVSGVRCQYRARAVIIATGKSPRKLGVPGEDECIGRGIVYGGAFNLKEYTGKRVAVVGGGNSAMDALSRLSSVASYLMSVHRGTTFSGEQVLVDRVSSIPQLERIVESHVLALEKLQDGVVLTLQTSDGGQQVCVVDAVVVAIGFESRNEWVVDSVPCDENKHILIDNQCRTQCEGVFAAGDCTTVPYQQIVISAGEGAKAAISAHHYLAKKEGKRALHVDWGFKEVKK